MQMDWLSTKSYPFSFFVEFFISINTNHIHMHTHSSVKVWIQVQIDTSVDTSSDRYKCGSKWSFLITNLLFYAYTDIKLFEYNFPR
jgi:hypothetical protein